MQIMGGLCLIAAVVSLIFGVRTLARPVTGDSGQRVLRAVAPAQIAVGVILAVGGLLVLAVLTLIIAITGALATLAAGAWQGARLIEVRPANVAAPSAAGCCGSGCGCAESAPVQETPQESGCGGGCACG